MASFSNFAIPIEIGGRPALCWITGQVLDRWWRSRIGSHDAARLVAANRERIDALIVEKAAAGDLQHGNVVIDEQDL